MVVYTFVEGPTQSSITSALDILVEEVDEIEQRPLVAPRELPICAIDHLQAILLVVGAEFVVVPGKQSVSYAIVVISLLGSSLLE